MLKKLYHVLLGLMIGFIFLLTSVCTAKAEVGITGANFLKYGLGVRPEALGGAFSAISDDVNSINFNPSGLTQIKDIEASFIYFLSFGDVGTNIVKLALPVSEDKTIGISLYIRDVPEIRNVETEPPVKARDSYFSFGYAQELLGFKNLSFGISGKYIYSSLAEIEASTYAFDAGLLYSLDLTAPLLPSQKKYLKIALVMQNLGPGIKFLEVEDPLPLNFKLGLAFNNYINPCLEYIIASDIDAPYKDTLKFHTGIEFILNRMFSFRIGYEYGRSGQEWGRITTGAGITWNSLGLKWQVNYAYSMFHYLNSVHGLDICAGFPLQ